jgi:hypothetical protein
MSRPELLDQLSASDQRFVADHVPAVVSEQNLREAAAATNG